MSDAKVDIMDNELCFCGKNRQWHRENETKHAFNAEDSKLNPRQVDRPAAERVTRIPSDPILRFLLIEKGIISADDLTEAEKKLQALGALSTGPIMRSGD